mmetsp:Transcript_4141/g.13623  ORF Transcript_4141/g.13623 Transcript_4141/m.13623 type:complete len:332 (-) Transcript_4141:207-1202(-)
MSSASYPKAILSSSARTIKDASNPFLSMCSKSCASSASSGTSFTPATPHNESTRFCSSDPSNGINVGIADGGGGDCTIALVGPVPLSTHSDAFCRRFTSESDCCSPWRALPLLLKFVAIPSKSARGSEDNGVGVIVVCSAFISGFTFAISSSSSGFPHGPLAVVPLLPRMASANDPPVISDFSYVSSTFVRCFSFSFAISFTCAPIFSATFIAVPPAVRSKPDATSRPVSEACCECCCECCPDIPTIFAESLPLLLLSLPIALPLVFVKLPNRHSVVSFACSNVFLPKFSPLSTTISPSIFATRLLRHNFISSGPSLAKIDASFNAFTRTF